MRLSEIFPALNDATYADRYARTVADSGTSASGDVQTYPNTSAYFDAIKAPADEDQ